MCVDIVVGAEGATNPAPVRVAFLSGGQNVFTRNMIAASVLLRQNFALWTFLELGLFVLGAVVTVEIDNRLIFTRAFTSHRLLYGVALHAPRVHEGRIEGSDINQVEKRTKSSVVLPNDLQRRGMLAVRTKQLGRLANATWR